MFFKTKERRIKNLLMHGFFKEEQINEGLSET